MMPGASDVWEEIGGGAARLSGGFNAVAPWRFEPLNENNPADSAWMWTSSSQREMESLTRALQRELCDARSNSEAASFAASLLKSDWKFKSEGNFSSEAERAMNLSENSRKMNLSKVNVLDEEEKAAKEDKFIISNAYEAEKRSNLSKNSKIFEPDRGKSLLRGRSSEGKDCDSLSVNRAGKMSKRRSRAANKTPITFLNADPANFRAMVQQVTGVPLHPAARLWPPAAAPPLLKPEPKRSSSTSSAASIIQGLPTLDTSAFFIHAARQNTASPELRSFAPRAASRKKLFLAEKLRAACAQSLAKHNGGGDFAADQANVVAAETDSWLNASNLDGILIGSGAELTGAAGSLPA